MSIIPRPRLNNVFDFFDKNIQFKTLQVKVSNGIYAKRAKTSIRKYPERYSSIQINSSQFINALVFDCDHNDVLEFTDYNLPTPTITVVNKHNGRHHHIYYLENPIPLFAASKQTKEFLKDLIYGLTKTLDADPNYVGIITKNFLNLKEFKVFGSMQKYELNDFVDFAENQNKLEKKKEDIVKEKSEIHFSRHITLFDKLRYFAYGIAKECNSYDELYNKLESYAIKINKTFQTPIKIKYILNSVTDYCWSNRDKFKGSKNWNWNYQKKSKEEVSQSHQRRHEREKEERYQNTIKKVQKFRRIRNKQSKFFKILAIFKNKQDNLFSNKAQINPIVSILPILIQPKNTKITIRYITRREKAEKIKLLLYDTLPT